MSKVTNLTGKKFGRLYVISRNGSNEHGRALWLCKCECGNIKTILSSSLINGSTNSCGCYNKETSRNRQLKHNKSNTKLYKVWQGIKTRCYDKNFMYYDNYGGRGIQVYDEWKNDFAKFYNWSMNNGYKEGLTIDRIDNDGNYEPSNCRWVTRAKQNNNMRKNILLHYHGEEKTISDWAIEFNLNRTALYYRIKRGWPLEQALTISTKGTQRKVFK